MWRGGIRCLCAVSPVPFPHLSPPTFWAPTPPPLQIDLYRDTRESIQLAARCGLALKDMQPAARERAFQREMKAENNLHPAMHSPQGHYLVGAPRALDRLVQGSLQGPWAFAWVDRHAFGGGGGGLLRETKARMRSLQTQRHGVLGCRGGLGCRGVLGCRDPTKAKTPATPQKLTAADAARRRPWDCAPAPGPQGHPHPLSQLHRDLRTAGGGGPAPAHDVLPPLVSAAVVGGLRMCHSLYASGSSG